MKGIVNIAGVDRSELEALRNELNSALEELGTSGEVNLLNYVKKAGDTMTGALVAQNNANYAVKQVRNVFLIQSGTSLPSGQNGDICLVYEV